MAGLILLVGFIYLMIGAVVSAVTTGRSVLDIILDVILWPVIGYFYILKWWRLVR